MTRRRSYKQFDYYGVAAIEAEYDDGFDSWEEIEGAFKKYKEINIKRSHDDVRIIGKIKNWDLDKTNRKAYVGINKTDLDDDIELSEINSVSIEYLTEGNKIVGIDHICIGNSFKPKCKKELCNITKQRGDEPDTEIDPVEEPDEIEVVIDEPNGSEEDTVDDEEIDELAKLNKEVEILRKQLEEQSKAKDKPEDEPDASEEDEVEDDDESEEEKKLKLTGFQKDKQHKIPTGEDIISETFSSWKYMGKYEYGKKSKNKMNIL